MKKFLAIFLGTKEDMEAFRALPEAERKEKEQAGMTAWMKWATENQKSIADMGSPLGKTKRITEEGISEIRNELGAWTVVQAESYDEAAKLFVDHPHFTIFPGNAVEIMECLPMPTR